MTRDGKTRLASVRTTRDRAIAFPPLEGGKKWKTLSAADLVLVSAVDDRFNPQNVDVHLFPGNEVRKRFDASYAARIAARHIVKDNWGMWITLDKGDDQVPSQVGHSLAIDYPRIARFTIDELEAELDPEIRKMADEAPLVEEEVSAPEAVVEGRRLGTVAEVLAFARKKIANLTGMPAETIKLDLKMGV